MTQDQSQEQVSETKREQDIKALEEKDNRLWLSIVTRFKTINKEYGQIKRETIEDAETLEEKCNIYGNPEQVKNIYSILAERAEKAELSENDIRYIRMVLPNKYKLLYSSTSQLGKLSPPHFKEPDLLITKECSIEKYMIQEACKTLSNIDLEVIRLEEFSEIFNRVQKIKNWFTRVARDAGIAEVGEQRGVSEKQEEEPIHIEPGHIPSTEEELRLRKVAHENWELIKETIDVLDADLDKWAPNDSAEWADYLNAQTAFLELSRPLKDKKWRRHWPQWVEIIRNYKEQGGTFASRKSTRPTGRYDIKKGKQIGRPITKEQIDATYVEKLNDMAFICDNILPFFLLFQNLERTQETQRDDRAVDLSPKLQASA